MIIVWGRVESVGTPFEILCIALNQTSSHQSNVSFNRACIYLTCCLFIRVYSVNNNIQCSFHESKLIPFPTWEIILKTFQRPCIIVLIILKSIHILLNNSKWPPPVLQYSHLVGLGALHRPPFHSPLPPDGFLLQAHPLPLPPGPHHHSRLLLLLADGLVHGFTPSSRKTFLLKPEKKRRDEGP